jgi:GGDEF domain-containing protein/GAF domain-containing protein
MEKALHYKRKISFGGKKTIMDRIAGPAETGQPVSETSKRDRSVPSRSDEILYLSRGDLVAVDDQGREVSAADLAAQKDGPSGGSDGGAVGDGKPKFTIEKEDDGKPRVSGSIYAKSTSWDDTGVLLDNMALYALSKDILGADSRKDLFDVILFSVMGQIGISSSSIMIPARDNPAVWEIVESRGVTINPDEIDFRPEAGILKQLISRKESIDIEEFKDNSDFGDDYLAYIAIDARMLVPFVYNQDVLGVLILGNKLNSEDYTGEEKGFFTVIAEYSAFAYRAIMFKEMSQAGSGPGSHIAAADRMRSRMVNEGHIGTIRDIIRDEFKQLGILSFGIFVKDEGSREYLLFAAEAEDRLKLNDLDFRIASTTSFIEDIAHAESPIIFNDIHRSKSLVEVFTDRQLRNMSMLDLFTFKLAGDMLGMAMIFDLDESADLDTVHARMAKFTDFIFPYIAIISEIEYRHGSYVDTIEGVFNRVEAEVANARNLNIPLSMVLLSVKNYKRYHGLFGHEKTKAMFNYLERFIRSRLSDRDFSVRYDRNKILIVLPGKDKRYAVPLANTICNEMTQAYSTRDVQLLVTFLTAEYPVDGKDAYSLVDAVN